jgi:ribosome biogenesis protein YTM1
MDRQVHVFSLPGDSLQRMLDPEQEVKGEEIMTLHLHSGPISSIAPSPDHSKLLSASWDGLLGLFALPTKDSPLEKIHDINQEPTNYLTNQDRRLGKKRKVEKTSTENGLAQAGSGGWRKRPDLVLRGHEGRIGGAIWDTVVTGTDAWSAGWDGSVRGWDTYEGRQKVLKVSPGRLFWASLVFGRQEID